MAVVYQKDKRSGITYAYDSVAHWDKEKKQSRAKRTLIGRLDPVSGEIVPTNQSHRRAQSAKNESLVHDALSVSRTFYGCTYLLDAIGEKTGITSDLAICFPDSYKQILSIAYYLILEDKNSLLRFPRWSSMHNHPYGSVITSQRSSELFASIKESSKFKFFNLQLKRKADHEYLAYDTTSISSYSKTLASVKYGKNKDNDPLPQINLALVMGEESALPFYYRKMQGNISDVTTILNLIIELKNMDCHNIKFVMDRGFYSKDNIDMLYKNNIKFLIAAKSGLKYISENITKEKEHIRSWNSYKEQYDLYSYTTPIAWEYMQYNRKTNREEKERRTLYLHTYFSLERAAEDERRQNILLRTLEQELSLGRKEPEHEKLYEKYFETTKNTTGGITVKPCTKEIEKAKTLYGYFTLISNDIQDSVQALEIYRNKDLAEKAFENLKERLNLKRTLVSSEASLEGKLFVEFISLIYMSYIKRQMQQEGLFKKYTMHELLDELDAIEKYERPDKGSFLSEITSSQKELYSAMGIEPPAVHR